MLVQFLLEKYKTKEPITQAALLKVVNKKYREHFPEILRRASERMELVFGLELKEVNPSNPSYSLVSKLALPSEEDLVGGVGLPKTGFLMTLLGVIFMKGNRASEEDIWDFLNVLGVHAGRRHIIFGEPRKFITQDLVQQKYLEYRQVPGSDPPTYEFLWGPRAHVETTKMKVLKVLAKISNTTPSAFPDLYEEALCDEAERASARFMARAGTTVRARVIMPRGPKGKLRTHRRRHQARANSRNQRRAPASAEQAPSTSSDLEAAPQVPPATEPISTSQGASVDTSDVTSDDDNGQDENNPYSAELSASEMSFGDILIVQTAVLEQFLLYKYKMKQPIKKEDMLKIVNQRYFPEILKKAAERIEIVFAVDLKEVDPTLHLYDLVSKLRLPNNGRVRAGRGLPKTGLLMTILGFIFMKGNRASEEDVWKFLNKMRVYPGRKHLVYGEPRKLITKDLVKLKYLEYRQIPNSDPARYEFLWGPRTYTETSKMKILEFLAKVNDTDPSAFTEQYEEALREEQERAQARAAVVPGRRAMVSPSLQCCPHSCLRSLGRVIMPRGAKSKLHASEKRRQARARTRACGAGQVTPAAGTEATPASSPSRESAPQSKPAAGPRSTSRGRQRKPTTTANSQPKLAVGFCRIPRGRQKTPPTASSSASTSPERSEGTATPDENTEYSYEVPGPEVIMKKASLLEQFLLYKYKMKQPIRKEDMLKVINPAFQSYFAEILKKASERIEMVFAVEVKEVDSVNYSYDLVSKLKLPNNGRVRAGRGLPKTGLLMNILGMIFMKGSCAKEEDIWKFLAMMRVYAGRKHFIYGEPRKLITKDLVRLKYLEYRQVANSDPPRFEFLWGPKAHAETSKMQVLKFLARINDTAPSTFQALYEEALKDEQERA
ncbi:Melanoma-associated antigen B3 [Galemys pyrenaicus]|uniref:Melanoma-associated antigen B3 n=1 Tax=Galemys pyrenaicus TaxID=202257 RepID=A0A8J6DQD2_GALPY|nr:Melanoma-associated antigen B3 [Galemys pyrenaicus]